MSSQTSLWTGLIGIGATIALVQPIAAAKFSVEEIAKTAQAITVLINEPNGVGSGVILQRQGEIYTVITAAHVVKNKANYTITTPDDRKYQIISSSIRPAPGSIDLAVVKFKSTTNYPTAKLGNCNALERGMDLYVGGFPERSRAITESIFVFREGKVSANSNKVLENGYSLLYSNDTVRGMSGGAVLNSEGELVAIHGRGDIDENDLKTRINLGIPINRFATVATKMGVELDRQVAPIPKNIAPKADDYFALAVQKSKKQDYRGSLADYNRAISLDPKYSKAYSGRGFLKVLNLNDPQGSLADYNRAIELAPNDAKAYNNRGFLKAEKLNDPQGGLADYNRVISLDPNFAAAYNNRGVLKYGKLNDPQGSLADYNRAIEFAPNFAQAYKNRGVLKAIKLNDPQGSLADYNRAISLDPNFAVAYGNRGLLKENKLDDRSGGVADLQQAARLFQQQGNTADYQKAIDVLKKIEGQNSQPIVTKPSNAEGYYRQGDKNVEAGNYRQAIVDFSRAISLSLNARSAPAYIDRGRSKYELKDDRGAISDYRKALSIDPQYASAYFNLGLVKAKSQDLKGAILDMQQAAKLYQQQGKQQDAQDAIAQIARWRQAQNNSGF
jgi:tetratricopeptide (TPR) repeat protein